MKSNKHLLLCWHGLTVEIDVPPNMTALPSVLCGHLWQQTKEFKSIRQVIEWLETIKQPRRSKTFRIWKYQIGISEYWN